MKRSRTSSNLRKKVKGSNQYGGEDGDSCRKARLCAMARMQAQRENGRVVSPQTFEEKTVVLNEMKGEKGSDHKEEALIIEVKKEENFEEVKGEAAAPFGASIDDNTVITEEKEEIEKVDGAEVVHDGGGMIFEQLENLTKSTAHPLGHWGQWNVENELVWREWINPSYVEGGNDEPAWLGDPVVIDNVEDEVLPKEEWDVPSVVAAPYEDEP